MSIRTWHVEMAFVAVVLSAVVLATGGGSVEWIGAGAVLLSFGHAQVADRLAEKEATRDVASVDCYRWATRYLLGKETLWCAFFVLHHSWSALAGVALFLAYPGWRRAWRKVYISHALRERTRGAVAESVLPPITGDTFTSLAKLIEAVRFEAMTREGAAVIARALVPDITEAQLAALFTFPPPPVDAVDAETETAA